MSDQNTVGEVEQGAEQESRRQHMGKVMWGAVARSFDGMRWMTEKTVGILRLFATIALFLIVIFVVWNAIQSAKNVVVKPFSVPKRMVDTHNDAGRIVANILKQELMAAEKDIVVNINQGSSESFSADASPFITSGEERSYIQGANIKLPETGISIDDVVEFIASIFGRENITGSVYEDQGKLYLQVELKGKIFLFARELKDTSSKSLNLDLLANMLHESRTQLLSVASEAYNLYYYCSDEVDDIEYKNGEFQKWFDYCTRLRSRDISPDKVRQLQTDLAQLNPASTNGNALLSAYILGLLKGKVQQKAELLCLDGVKPAKDVKCVPEAKTVTAATMAEPSGSVPPTPAAPTATEHAEAPDSTPNLSAATSAMAMTEPTPAPQPLPGQVERLHTQCRSQIESDGDNVLQSVIQQSAATTSINPQNARLSNQLEGDASALLHNKLFDKAATNFEESISLNCRNAFAWANLGILYSSPDNPFRDPSQARLALGIATQLNTSAGWMQHSLCVAEAYATKDKPLEDSLTNNSCQQARAIEPANAILYDKLFYISIADEYMRREKYPQAFDAYQKSMATDKKRDCRMQGVLSQMAVLANQYNIAGAKQAACGIIKDAYTLPDAEASECEADLDAFASGC